MVANTFITPSQLSQMLHVKKKKTVFATLPATSFHLAGASFPMYLLACNTKTAMVPTIANTAKLRVAFPDLSQRKHVLDSKALLHVFAFHKTVVDTPLVHVEDTE
mmetsp:Transcript_17154/g.32559  ORF Transcript_17154/g.32559 Transcript_17154/m.32559 type:complete len:105 (+) Transcript_17154:2464-2778(+)